MTRKQTGETRENIMSLLHRADDATINELSDLLDLDWSAIHYHLRKLQDDGLVDKIKEGRTVRWRAI